MCIICFCNRYTVPCFHDRLGIFTCNRESVGCVIFINSDVVASHQFRFKLIRHLVRYVFRTHFIVFHRFSQCVKLRTVDRIGWSCGDTTCCYINNLALLICRPNTHHWIWCCTCKIVGFTANINVCNRICRRYRRICP